MQNSQRQIFEEQIQLLKIQIDEQNKRQSKLRELIDTLTQQMKYQRQIQEQNYRLTHLNQKLMNGIKDAKNKHIQEISYYDDQIQKLKQQIQDKTNENQRCRLQFQRRQLVFVEKTAMLQSIIEKKCHRVCELEKKIHDDSISKLKQKQKENNISVHNLSYSRANPQSDRNFAPLSHTNADLGMSALRISQISNNFDTQNNMRASNISTLSRKSKGSEYMSMNKSQMKVMMGALIKSKRELEKGSSKTEDQNNQRANKTVLN